MPYSWHILKPNLTSARDQLLPSSAINWETLEFYPDESPCFFVEPMQGTLQPDGIHEFVVTFAPNQVNLKSTSKLLKKGDNLICVTCVRTAAIFSQDKEERWAKCFAFERGIARHIFY